MSGQTQKSVAKHFNVNPNTVSKLVQRVTHVQGSAFSPDWRRKLVEQLPGPSVDALERSIKDTESPHQAASTALAVLKGLGHLQGDRAGDVNVFLNTVGSAYPEDIQNALGYSQDANIIEATPTPLGLDESQDK